jgi:hypothetical protein
MSGEIIKRSRHEVQTTCTLAARIGQLCPAVEASKIAETASKLYKIASSVYRSQDNQDIVSELMERGQVAARAVGAHFLISFTPSTACFLSFNGQLEKII